MVNFHYAFRCLTADVVMNFCFQSDLGALASPGFRNTTLETFVEGTEMAMVPFHFPSFFALVTKVIFALPDKVRKEKFAGVHGFQMMQALARARVEDAIARAKGEKRDSGKVAGRENADEEKTLTMFDLMLRPDVSKGQISPSENDMVADGCLMIAAGTDTTANTLGTVLFHVTQNPSIEAKLLQELKHRIGKDEIVDSASLEGKGFEYLRAVVKEGLRLSYGVPGRILRKVPKEGARFGDVHVPGGVSLRIFISCVKPEDSLTVQQITITSSIYLQNADAETFPDPFKFDPERWLCDFEMYRLRDRQMLSFSRGSRSCVGIK